MKVDETLSRYRESSDVDREFSRVELLHLRQVLRRLRFLEAKIRESGGSASPDANGGAIHTEREVIALEWLLAEVGFIEPVED